MLEEYKKAEGSPVGEYRRIVIDDSDASGYTNRVLIGHPVTGLVRIEWHQSVTGQIIPVNWGQVTAIEGIPAYLPLRFQVADAQNLIVKRAIEMDFEWLLLWEHDVLPPPNTYMKLDKYMHKAGAPVVSGLYWTRNRPSYPLIFRGRGTGSYYDWEPGDKVWCDGVPTGFLLIHVGVLKQMWDDAEEYQINYGSEPRKTRNVFRTPRDLWQDPETGRYNTISGTSDLDWCTKVIEGDYFRKAGWNDFMDRLEDPEYPFLVDTSIFCRHINPDGEQFP